MSVKNSHKTWKRVCVVADLQLCFLHSDLTVDPRALVSTHRLQMLFIEGEQLCTCQDAQTLHRPATEHTSQ